MTSGSVVMKVISAITGTPSMNKGEVDTFLENKLNLQIGTIDDDGDPNIQPVWFNYDSAREKFLVITPKAAKKIKNLRKKPNVYFSIDDENFPYKGVKGKGIATVVEDPDKTVPEAKKINLKYLGTLDHPIPRMILESA
jgi:PPOX class probable F420-dependent enzyme